MSSSPSAIKTTTRPDRASPPSTFGTEHLVRGSFDDVALLIGSVAVIHHLDDDLTWTLMKRLDGIRVRLLRDLKGEARRGEFRPSVAQIPRVHASVEEFLARNRAGMGE